MLTGRAPGAGPKAVKYERTWLALVMPLSTLTFGAIVWPDRSPASSVRAQKAGSRTVPDTRQYDHRAERRGR